MMRVNIDGDLLEMVKQRIRESRDQTAVARKGYIAHLREHGRDKALPKNTFEDLKRFRADQSLTSRTE